MDRNDFDYIMLIWNKRSPDLHREEDGSKSTRWRERETSKKLFCVVGSGQMLSPGNRDRTPTGRMWYNGPIATQCRRLEDGGEPPGSRHLRRKEFHIQWWEGNEVIKWLNEKRRIKSHPPRCAWGRENTWLWMTCRGSNMKKKNRERAGWEKKPSRFGER